MYMFVCACICMHTYVYMCVYVCIYIYIYVWAFLWFDSLNTAFLLSHMAQCLCLVVRLSRLGEEIGCRARSLAILVWSACGEPLAHGSPCFTTGRVGWARVLPPGLLRATVENDLCPLLQYDAWSCIFNVHGLMGRRSGFAASDSQPLRAQRVTTRILYGEVLHVCRVYDYAPRGWPFG